MTWKELYDGALKFVNYKEYNSLISAGQVAAAIETESGNVYYGVCVDTACGLGVCGERNAIFNMLTHGESKIKKLVAVDKNGDVGSPCCACRELLMQLDANSGEIEILLSAKTEKTIKLKQLVPDWWAADRV